MFEIAPSHDSRTQGWQLIAPLKELSDNTFDEIILSLLASETPVSLQQSASCHCLRRYRTNEVDN